MHAPTRLAAALAALALASCFRAPITSSAPAAPPTAETLLGSEWRLQDLAGTGVIARTQPSLAFPQAGRVAGDASCNRFTGGVEVGSGTIHFGRLAATRRACAPAVMDQEAKYLAALETSERAAFEGRYLLLYPRNAEKPLRFVRVVVPGAQE